MILYAKLYLYIAIASTIFYLLKLLLFFIFGGDTEVHADFDSETETDVSFNFLSVQSILAFLMGFGWLGLACLNQWNMNIVHTSLISTAFGIVLMTATAWLMYQVKKLNHIIVVDINACVGKIGKSYTHFAPNEKGKIEVEINNQINILDAINNTEEEIPAFKEIKVIKCENEILYIEKI